MTELDAEHVERDPVPGNGGGIGGEGEPGVGVDEAANDPGARDSIDARAGPCHPEAAAVLLAASEGVSSHHGHHREGTARGLDLQPIQQAHHPVPSAAPEEINGFDIGEAALELLHPPAGGRGRTPLGRPRLRDAPEGALDLLSKLSVALLTRAPKLLDDLVVGPAVHTIGGEDACFSTRGLDLPFEPFEVLARGRGVRQNVGRLFDGDGAQLPQAPPGSHPEVRGRRGQLVHQQEPSPRRAVLVLSGHGQPAKLNRAARPSARSYTATAATRSWRAIPVLSKIVISSSEVRPGARPATTAPSSARTSSTRMCPP